MKLCVCYNLLRVTEGGDRMKESAGEANMTVITIVLIGLVAAAGAIIIPNLLNSMSKKACCSSYGGTWKNNGCVGKNTYGGDVPIAEGTYWDKAYKKCKE